MSRTLHCIVAISILLITACGDGGTEPPSGSPSLSIGADTVLLLDERHPLAATALDGRGRPMQGVSIDWTSSAPGIVSVDGTGRLTALEIGTATITATLSDGTTDAATVNVAPHFRQIAPGGTHTCGITGRGEVYCWGIAANGELGPAPEIRDCGNRYGGGIMCSTVPIRSSSPQADTIVAGGMHNCALDAEGAAWCWGSNFYGQSGTGSITNEATPTRVVGGHDFVQLTAGRMHTCGITVSRDAYCWGWDHTGQLGAGDVSTGQCSFFGDGPCSATPRLVVGGHEWAQLSASDRATCGVTTDGDVYCWGLDVNGSDGMYCQTAEWLEGCTRTPLLVASERSYRAVSIGDVHRCQHALDDTLDCWGASYWGMFGNGNDVGSSTPVLAAGGASFASFHAGRTGSCALTSDGSAQCWGFGENGAIGDGGTDHALVPTDVAGEHTFEWLASSGNADHFCGLAATGRAYCWGLGEFAQIGDGGYESRSVPSLVLLVADAP